MFSNLLFSGSSFSFKSAYTNQSQFASIIPDPKPHGGDVSLAISPDSADYLVSTDDAFICFRLTETGKRLRNVIIGLGYELDLSCSDSVSFLPLFAYFKAWYDCYAPSRETQWNQTNAFILIDASFQNYLIDLNHFTTYGGSTEKIQKPC